MLKEDIPGSFEQLVLLAVLRLGDNAYGMTVRRELEMRTGQPVSLGAVYTTLERLEKKGYLGSRTAAGGPEREGRARRLFTVDGSGRGGAAARAGRAGPDAGRLAHLAPRGCQTMTITPASTSLLDTIPGGALLARVLRPLLLRRARGGVPRRPGGGGPPPAARQLAPAGGAVDVGADPALAAQPARLCACSGWPRRRWLSADERVAWPAWRGCVLAGRAGSSPGPAAVAGGVVVRPRAGPGGGAWAGCSRGWTRWTRPARTSICGQRRCSTPTPRASELAASHRAPAPPPPARRPRPARRRSLPAPAPHRRCRPARPPTR